MPQPQQRVNASSAYLFWCLSLFGICGIQRFYTGNIGSGIIYLFTWGFFGIGQFIDLFLIPEMVVRRNYHLATLNGEISPQVTLNIGEIPPTTEFVPAKRLQPTETPMIKLLQVATECGGTVSKAQIAMRTGFPPAEIDKLLEEALRQDYADVVNDPETGAVRYRFDV
jgi:TM2 domain-containing membrane protein YozV